MTIAVDLGRKATKQSGKACANRNNPRSDCSNKSRLTRDYLIALFIEISMTVMSVLMLFQLLQTPRENSWVSEIYHHGLISHRYRRQSKTLLTIDERGSKIARNSIFDCRATNGNRKLCFKRFFSTFVESINVLDCRLSGVDFVNAVCCLFDLILYGPSTIFQLNRDWSSWVELVLSWDKSVLLKDHNGETSVRLEPHGVYSEIFTHT